MKSYMVIDGQWGSTGKGAIAGYLSRVRYPDTVVCNFGPNAGHTFVFTGGQKVMTRQLPTGIVSASVQRIFLGPGSIIDPDVLRHELDEFAAMLKGKPIFIHERAAYVDQSHRDQEKEALCHISSTGKGTGAAMAAKTMRRDDAIIRAHRHKFPEVEIVDHNMYTRLLLESKILQIESAQGFELGINSGSHYPFCTGRDINPAQVMSDCGVPMWTSYPTVIATMRTFPIRVGDQYNEAGEKVGTSGPVYHDQQEVTFEDIGVPNEKTTVTGKIRRVFTFSDYATVRMIRSMCPDYIFLNFVNYISNDPTFEDPAVERLINRIKNAYRIAMNQTPPVNYVRWIGTGPEEHQIMEHLGVMR
jgi:adenylosuccinate synthase